MNNHQYWNNSFRQLPKLQTWPNTLNFEMADHCFINFYSTCKVSLSHFQINLHWIDYDMSTPQICEDSFIEAFERTTAESDRRKQFCGGIAKDFKTSSNHVYLRIFANNPTLVPFFQALLTVFVHGKYKLPLIYHILLLRVPVHSCAEWVRSGKDWIWPVANRCQNRCYIANHRCSTNGIKYLHRQARQSPSRWSQL